ncbi:NUDIX domain-containing protein [Psychrobium sp. MM17-31]|uniref:NUDIX hydrolase n=1 Tax=Psychrobium sp. MM17-31 TaxID=2917758 RepID=UPI001EF441C6|nr:NUDIX domain-containing protein [Psychrobium sp. MM17-31]
MNNIIKKAAWITIKDRKLLCVRSTGKTLFYVPGGKIEANESIEQALIREIKEELSVSLIESSIAKCCTVTSPADGKPAGTLVELSCFTANYSGTLTVNAEIEELAWLGIEDTERCSVATRALFEKLISLKRLK